MSAEDEFLPVDKAFRLHIERQADTSITAHWDIAPDYYLYRKSLRFTGDGVGDARLPVGVIKEDEFFGRVETYEGILRIPINVTPQASHIEIAYQGCASAGLCYAPQKRQFNLANIAPISAVSIPDTAPLASPPLAEDQKLANWLAERSLAWNILLFFALGLLLVFTPCVLPMVPIIFSLLARQGTQLTPLRGFLLSSSYVLSMAFVYALAGVLAAWGGASIQAAWQQPIVLLSFAVLFILLALSMFGVYELRLPSRLQEKISNWSDRQRTGTIIGAVIMGALSALVVSPCIAPPLVGALLYIAETGNALYGAIALFALGIGMGAPLILLGSAFGNILPRSGAWMEHIKWIFGYMLLGLAVWLVERVLPAPTALALWGIWGIAVSVWLISFVHQQGSIWHVLRRTVALLIALWSILLLTSAASGGNSITMPLSHWFTSSTAMQKPAHSFEPIKDVRQLQHILATTDQPVLLDFYADWCIACKTMEKYVFPNPQVRQVMNKYRLLQADVTANDTLDKELQQAYQVIGPPTILVFDRHGREERHLRLVGEISAEQMITTLR